MIEKDIADIERGRASRAARKLKLLRPLDERAGGKRREQDQEQRGKQAARPSGIESGQVEARRAANLSHHEPGDQVTGEDEHRPRR